MKNFLRHSIVTLILSTSTAFAVTAQAAATVFPTENLLCTRDYNPWGLASRCQCPEQTNYEYRLGSCIQGELEPVMAEGPISTQVAAIGGETTGVVIESADVGSYELVLPLQWKAELEAAEGQGLSYTITGDYIALPGVESGPRPTILVNTLTVAGDSSAP